ncbi:hypothetical protein LCGC14_0567090 [marine sediment metagenome]|uniref:Uncharacterized protein n=1 Tax=marine sediment metagenome TaxID=412755 RepID=A0A0F9S3Z9_9ZZZZ
MRMKKFRQILDLLPASDDLNKVKQKFDDKAVKTKNFILKAKKIGRYLLEIYLIISYLAQTLGLV